MSKRNWFVESIKLTLLAGVVLVAGCEKKKAEDKGSSGPGVAAPAKDDKGAMPGVTATEIKIGQTMPYSGPASAYGVIGKTEQGFFKMINEKGGVNGRKINLVSLDDAYNPPKSVEQIRKLVENEGVAFIFNSLGTPSNTAIQPYLTEKKVPQLFVATGADKWADPEKHPWTMGWQPSYRLESQIYGKYLLKEKPNAKLCVLYQNDDFGKDYLTGLKQGLGDQYDKVVIKTASYEATDPTVDSQVVSLQAAGCDALLTAAIPKFAAQTIRKIFDINWKPFHLLSNVAISRTAVLQPAGLDKSTGVISGLYLNDPADPTLADDPGMNEYRAFMKQYLPDMDPNDGNSVYAFGVSTTLVKVLTQCGNDLSRENIMKQAASVSKLVVPVAVKGVEVTTSATNFHPIAQMQLAKFNGTSFERFGEVIAAQ
ncbi:MAG TPA: ABC transporter substrate-binding protein [Kofleriaceae bacterium]|jgi:branched-chain amino acid transport system substrate-binding protein|nr:ABC transporter substrate-binding protein [Kofleriaceae bacterium]